MTFSRPRIGPTDAMGRITKPNEQRGADRVYVPEVNSARFSDNRNPGVIRAAGEADAARIGQFMQGLSKLVDTGAEVIEKKLDTSQLEQVLAKPETADAIRKWDKESRDMFAGLRPNVRDQIGDMSAQLKISNYQDRLSVEALKQPSLYLGKPEDQTEEQYRKQKALARKDLYDRVAKETGLDQIEPRYLARHIGKKAAAEAATYGIEETERYKRDAEKRDAILGEAMVESLRFNFQSVRGAEAAVNDPKASPEQKQIAQTQLNWAKAKGSENFRNTVMGQMWERANDLGMKPSEFATKLLSSINTIASQGTIAGEPQSSEETQRMLKDMGELFNGKFQIPGIGVDLMSIPVTQGGLTLPAAIQELQNKYYPALKQARADEQFRGQFPYILNAAQGDTAAQAGIINLISANKNNPNYDFKQAISVLDSVRGMLKQPTDAQEKNFAGIVAEMNNPNADRTTLNQKISEYANSGRLQWDQAARLFGQNQERNKPGGNREGRIHSAMQESSPLFDSITRQWATELSKKGLAPDKQSVKAFEDAVAMTALLNTKKIVDAKVQSTGKELTDDEVRVTLRNEIEVIRKNRLKDAKQDPDKYQNFNDKQFNMIQDIQNNLKNGKRDVQIFTPEFVEQYRQTNPNQRAGYTELNRYVIKIMGQIEGEKDGKTIKVYSNPQEEWRKWFDEGKRKQGQQQMQPSTSLQKASIEQGSPDFLQALNDVMPRLGMTAMDIATGSSSASAAEMLTKSAPVKTGTTVPSQQQTQQAPQPQPKKQDMGSEILTRGIAAAAGVSATVLSTRKPLDLVVNANSLEALSRLFKKREAMTMETPKLPQTVASAPTTPAPLAINNDRHPMFVLIGLNEGTRTLDGGYTQAYYGHTDPGNGARNVGTVSGQQGGTPQQSDRRWAGILTGVATKVAPYMAKLGLSESTVGYQRILFNVLDLYVQAPAAVPDFIKKIQQVIASGMSIEAIAKARADSFFNPATGRLDASGFGNSYSRLLADQRARAGTWDYKRRL